MPLDPLMYLLGLVGAAILVFSRLGGLLPGMTETPTIKGLKADISTKDDQVGQLWDRHQRILQKTEETREKFSKREIAREDFQAIDKSLNDERDDINDLRNAVESERLGLAHRLRSETGKVFLIASLLYVGIGTVLAGLFATEPVNAIVIGASWTSIISLIEQKGTELKWDKTLSSSLEKAEKATQLTQELTAKLQQVSEERDRLLTLFDKYKAIAKAGAQ